jgi:hypothetical protein
LSDGPDYITVNHACRIVGGDEKPISAATYYRGVKAGRLPAPEHPTPGVSRIRRGELIARLNGGDDPPENASAANSCSTRSDGGATDTSAGRQSNHSIRRIESIPQAFPNGRAAR